MGRTAATLVTVLALAGGARADDAAPALDVGAIQKLIVEQKLDGWLLYDFRGVNGIAQELVRPKGHQSRRWFYLIPAKGEPVGVVHRIEATSFAGLPGTLVAFSSWKELEAALRGALKGKKRVAMEYFPRGHIAPLSRVDAGTVELVRSLGVTVVPSGELVQAIRSVWSPEGRESHLRAAREIERVKDESFAFIARRLREGRAVTEWDVASRIRKALEMRGMEGSLPIVAAGPNTANPHYLTAETTAATIREGDVIILDITTRQKVPGAICADQTWMAYAGPAVPDKVARLFAAVREARDAALALVKDRHAQKKALRGFEVDNAARRVIEKAGHGAAFIHRTGHSIDRRCHGDGVNMDDYESHDERMLIHGVGFSIEPGIYLAGEVGVRSEIDVFYGKDGVEVTTNGVQGEIQALGKPAAAAPTQP